MDEDVRVQESGETANDERGFLGRRGFLVSLKKWSMVVIGGALLGGVQLVGEPKTDAAGAWANRAVGGGAWANRAGGGGAWANRAVGGGAWANRAGAGGAWVNRGAAWANRGAVWANRF